MRDIDQDPQQLALSVLIWMHGHNIINFQSWIQENWTESKRSLRQSALTPSNQYSLNAEWSSDLLVHMTKHGDLQIGVKSANKSESKSIFSIQIVTEEKSKAITTALVYLDQRPWPRFL
jgi:hypothetical protein